MEIRRGRFFCVLHVVYKEKPTFRSLEWNIRKTCGRIYASKCATGYRYVCGFLRSGISHRKRKKKRRGKTKKEKRKRENEKRKWKIFQSHGGLYGGDGLAVVGCAPPGPTSDRPCAERYGRYHDARMSKFSEVRLHEKSIP